MSLHIFDNVKNFLERGVVASTRLELNTFRSKLVVANTATHDELATLTQHAIDLIDDYNKTQDSCERLATLGHIYFTVNIGLGLVTQNKAPDILSRHRRGAMGSFAPRTVQGVDLDLANRRADRRQVLEDLFRAVAARLAACFKTTVNVLPRYLEDRFGTEIQEASATEDFKKLFGTPGVRDSKPQLTYLTTIQRARYKVLFRNGLAYSLIDRFGQPAEEALLDTTEFLPTNKGKHREYSWGFVLSLSREFFVMSHAHGADSEGSKQFFHSSYLAGTNVLTAGDCTFRQGRLERITNFSGHYRPSAESLLHALDLFRSRGVDLSNVIVYATDGQMGDFTHTWGQEDEFLEGAYRAEAFIEMTKDWSHLKKQRPRSKAVSQLRNYVSNR